MDERIIIKSERIDVKKVAAIIVIVGFSLLIAYIVFDIIKYSKDYYKLAAKNYYWFDYSSPLEMGLSRAFGQDGGLIFAFMLPVIFGVIAFIVYRAYSKIELTVTDKRVYGCATFGKRVDLPLDAISAVGTSSRNGIDVTTASGAIKFKYIMNHDELHSAISDLLVKRQSKPATATTTIKQEIPQSNADEIKKYKELLDTGVISQEEFDAKKKQLLCL